MPVFTYYFCYLEVHIEITSDVVASYLDLFRDETGEILEEFVSRRSFTGIDLIASARVEKPSNEKLHL